MICYLLGTLIQCLPLTLSLLPSSSHQVYLLASLFPGARDHPVLHDVQLPVQRKISTQRALKDFHDLCLDRKVRGLLHPDP